MTLTSRNRWAGRAFIAAWQHSAFLLSGRYTVELPIIVAIATETRKPRSHIPNIGQHAHNRCKRAFPANLALSSWEEHTQALPAPPTTLLTHCLDKNLSD